MAKKILKKKSSDKATAKKPSAAKKAAKKTAPAKKAAPAKPAKKAAAPKKAAPAPKLAKKAAKPAKAAKVAAAPAKKAAPAPVAPKVAEKPVKAPKPPKEIKAKAPIEEPAADAAADEAPEEIVLTDAEGRRYCRVKDCDQLAAVDTYCRYHYLLFWKKIQVRKKILTEGKLERYIEELTARYPDKFLDMLRKDLRSEKEFLAAIQELEIDESGVDNEFEDEAQTYIDEVRGDVGSGAREEEDF